MFDSHTRITGVFPYIFGISSYSIFVLLGIIIGLVYYLLDAKKRKVKNEGVILIVVSALIFGMFGSKIPLILENRDLNFILSGKSIIGGLIGGTLGVILIKKIFKINLKLGNIIAPSVALGMSVGRLGCFFNGCCFGVVSNWGGDFGDELLRLPTQLFEAAFHFIAFLILHKLKNIVKTKGILFKFYVLAYFIFRFFIEFIRENPIIYLGMSIYQIICLICIFYLGVVIGFKYIKKRGVMCGEE